jgi:Family of unknown function (DUF5343)
MATKLPYVAVPGTIVKILNKVKEAKTPDRFTADFLETKLGFKGGNSRQFIPLSKKLGLLKSDGTPTDLYKKFRNDSTSGAAMAEALKIGYRDAFERNEYANELDKESFKGLVVEITGLEVKNKVVQLICQTFESLKKFANFEVLLPEVIKEETISKKEETAKPIETREFDLNLSYTINLVLPKTDDPAVFNAIFRSLRDTLLRK